VTVNPGHIIGVKNKICMCSQILGADVVRCIAGVKVIRIEEESLIVEDCSNQCNPMGAIGIDWNQNGRRVNGGFLLCLL
jgi:hypothetical protein